MASHDATDMNTNANTGIANENDNGKSDSAEIDAPAGFSRDPADYYPTDHFLSRFSARCGSRAEMRHAPPITSDVVEQCSERGALLPAANDCWRLEADGGGHHWRLVVDVCEAEDTRVLTALVPGIHRPGDHCLDDRSGDDRA